MTGKQKQTEEEQELFEKFESKILRNLPIHQPAEQRGFSHAGIDNESSIVRSLIE